MTATLRITHFRWLHPKGFFVQWSLTDPIPGGVLFTLERSGGAEGPWDTIGNGLNTYAFIDRFTSTDSLPPNQFRLFKSFFYRITALFSDRTTTSHSHRAEVIQQGKVEGYRRKAVRDLERGLRKFTNTPCALLKRRVWGERCPKCFDQKTKAGTKGNCRNCFGTTFTGGYWAPTTLYARRDAPQSAVSLSETKSDAAVVQMTITDTPAVEHGDIIVFLDDNKRYRIEMQSETQVRLATLKQSFTGQEIDHSNVVYEYRVDPTSVHPLF